MIRIITLITFLFYAITSIAQVVTCDVKNTGNIKTHGDSKVGIYGNLINDGDFSENTTNGTSEVGFYNDQTSLSISGTTPPRFSDLIVSVPNDINLDVNVIASNSTTFDAGRLLTQRNTPTVSLDLIDDAIYVNEGNTTHVDGYTSYTGVLEYFFPIGDDNRLRMLGIDANTAINTAKAAYFFEDANTTSFFPSSPFGFDRNNKEDSVENISSFEFWDLDGNSSTRATLTWDALSNVSSLIQNNNLNELRVVGWSIADQQWVDLGNTAISGNINQGQITSEVFNPNDFEVITFAGSERIIETTPLTVYNAISPDNDGEDNNDFFRIGGIENFPNNTLRIFNRWGVEVYSKSGYNNIDDVFTGRSTGRATIREEDLLPSGTYYYVLNYEVDIQGGEKCLAGYLYINR